MLRPVERVLIETLHDIEKEEKRERPRHAFWFHSGLIYAKMDRRLPKRQVVSSLLLVATLVAGLVASFLFATMKSEFQAMWIVLLLVDAILLVATGRNKLVRASLDQAWTSVLFGRSNSGRPDGGPDDSEKHT